MNKQQKHTAKKTPSMSVESWISIANLILTAIVGVIIAILLAKSEQSFQAELQKKDQIFQATLQARDEELQKTLIELQITAQQADIQISHFVNLEQLPGAGNGIMVSNNGITVADNLTITVCLLSLNPAWKEVINSIEDFEIKQLNTALAFSMEYQKKDCPFGFPEGRNNAIILQIDKLPPNQYANIEIGVKDILDFNSSSSTITAFMVVPQPEWLKLDEQTDWQQGLAFSTITPLINFATSEFSVARFFADATCDNCNVTRDLKEAIIPVTTSSSAYDFKVIDLLSNGLIRVSGSLRLIYKSPRPITNEISMYLMGQIKRRNDGFEYFEFYDTGNYVKETYFP